MENISTLSLIAVVCMALGGSGRCIMELNYFGQNCVNLFSEYMTMFLHAF